MQPNEITDPQCECGEGPIWHPGQNKLYWVDIPLGHLYRYDPATANSELIYEDTGRLGGITVQADGSLLLFGDSGCVKRWARGTIETLIDRIPGEESTRFNDVIADPRGRVFAGMMGTDTRDGRLYRIEPDGSYSYVLDGIGTPNGLGFAPENEYFYFTDSGTNTIYQYEYDEATGVLSNRRVFAEVPESQGTPDGLTIDAEGYVWSARWNGNCVVRYAPDGTEEMRIDLPAERATSVMLGGDSFNSLYITTAGGDNRSKEGPGAGAVFEVAVDIRGTPEYRSRLFT